MKKKTYAELLKDPRWQKKRLEILQAADFSCQLCGDTNQTLHVHHGSYLKGKKPWEYEDDMYHVLCESCHDESSEEQYDLNASIARLSPEHYYDLYKIVTAATKPKCDTSLMFAFEAICDLFDLDQSDIVRISDLECIKDCKDYFFPEKLRKIRNS